jgi:hypothetical protein
VHLSGYVSDESPSNLTVHFTGVVSGQSTTDSNGHFDFYGQATALGNVTASVVDGEGFSAQPATATISSQAPAIANLSASEAANYVTVSGVVQDESPGNRTVSFGGIGSGTATTTFDGHFTAYVSASSLGTLTATVQDPWGQQGTAQATLTSDTPVIDTLNVTPSYGRYVTISGHVTDASAGQATLALSGVVSGTYSIGSNGNFSIFAQASNLGTISAVATDKWGQASTTTTTTITDAAPTIENLNVTLSSTGRYVTITGHVTDAAASQATVTLSGVVGGTHSVNSDGSFSIYTLASGLGAFSVVATDVWGQASTAAEGQVQSAAPTLRNVHVYQEFGDWWGIEGSVADDQIVMGLTVTFGGYLQGSSTNVQSDGTFCLAFTFTGSVNTITVVVHDWWGQASNACSVIIG